MNIRKILIFGFMFLAFSSSFILAKDFKETEKQIQEPEQADSWQFKIGIPAWIAGIQGDTGINGSTLHSTIGFNEIANKIDMAASFRAEASKGRFGIMADFSYFSISDSIGTDGILSKLDVREDQTLAELGLRWRLIDKPRGSLDVIGGVRYTYLYEEIGLHSNDQQIGQIADRLATAGTLLRLRLARELRTLRNAHFANSGLTAGETERVATAIDRIKSNTADRAREIEKVLKKNLNRRISRTDQWLDPYIGLRGRYNVTDSFYLMGRADVSPFDVGADFAWQASGGFGFQLTPRIYSEIVYRVLDVDYRHNGLIYDVTSHGPEVTMGILF